MTTEALVPAAAALAIATGGGGEIVLPQVIVDAGPQFPSWQANSKRGPDVTLRAAASADNGKRAVHGRVKRVPSVIVAS